MCPWLKLYKSVCLLTEVSSAGEEQHWNDKLAFAGLLALGHHHGVNTAREGEPDDLAVAEDLMRTCYEMYRRTPTGLAPEIAFFKTKEAAAHGLSQAGDPEAGGGDFVIKIHVRAPAWHASLHTNLGSLLSCCLVLHIYNQLPNALAGCYTAADHCSGIGGRRNIRMEHFAQDHSAC